MSTYFSPQSALFVTKSCIDWNRDVLKKELGLDDEDIIDVPVLFNLVAEGEDVEEYRALAYYPDMWQNHKSLGVQGTAIYTRISCHSTNTTGHEM
ncbi:Protein-arginine deiminase type-2 [Larimichthys crocea]|uniref:Uncharacterized protein n=1 Tax=Larimichthys crocea TaxID=215358 RepID=A0ACD3RHK5_LARCR|nr:Protein-arginine deiminase type-2 [Larimichthys crocea]